MLLKKSRVVSTVVLAIFGLTLTASLVARHSKRVSAAQNPPTGVQAAPAVPAVPDGTLVYKAKATTTALFLAHLNHTSSSSFTTAVFEDAIRQANGRKPSLHRD